MATSEKVKRLKGMLQRLAADQDLDLEALAKRFQEPWKDGVERDAESVHAQTGLEKLAANQLESVAPEEVSGLEAIVMQKLRPVAFVRQGAYDALEDPWSDLNEAA